MKKQFIVCLTDAELGDLRNLVRKVKAAAYRWTHAKILLLVDEGQHGGGLRDREAAEAERS